MEMDIKILKKTLVTDDISYTHNHTGIEQIFCQNNFHVGRYNLPKDTFLYVNPTDAPKIVKSYTVIEGSMMELKSRNILSQGDVFIVNFENRIHSFYNLENTILIIHEQSAASISSFKTSSSKMIEMLEEIQSKDNYTKEHSERVFHLAKEMGLALKYHSKQIYNLNKASRFHDIGKIFIDDTLLNKPTHLTQDETLEMKKHTEHSRKIILDIFDEEIFNIINQHHERIDGTGYPNGLMGDQILEESKILAICDSFDAMTTDRVYKKGKTIEVALKELHELAGKQYDESLVELFIKLNRNKEN